MQKWPSATVIDFEPKINLLKWGLLVHILQVEYGLYM